MTDSGEGTYRSVARSTLLTAGLTGIWMIIVYATQVALAAWFGTGKEMDAYLAATSMPFFISTLLVEALTLAFVPVFMEYHARGDVASAWRTTTILLTFLGLFLGFLSVTGVLFSPQLIHVLVPGFDSQRYALATTMSQIIFPTVFFSSIAGLLNSLYYAHKRFLIPALSPVVGSALNLALILALARQIGIISSAWGALWASVAQCAFTVPILFRRDLRLSLNWRDPGVREVTRLIGWRVLGEMFGKATPLVDRYIASTLAIGAISYLGYASRIVSLVLGVVVQSIATVLFPFLSERAAETDPAALGRGVSMGMRMTALIALPISALFLVLSVPTVRVLFQRGQFDEQATIAVAAAVVAYFGIWLSNALGGAIVPSLYALRQMRAVAFTEVGGVLIYALSALTLPRWFGYLGLALALSINFVFNTAIYAYYLFVRLHVPFDAQIARFYIKCILATGASSWSAWLVYPILVQVFELNNFSDITRVLIDAGAIGGAATIALGIYAIVLVFMRSEEIVILWNVISHRLPVISR